MSQSILPPVIRIEPSASCNLACAHCPTGTIEMTRGIMKKNIFDKILKELESHKNTVRVVVLYHGGEPLLNKHFATMVRQIKNIGISQVKTVSNGMLIDDAKIKEIIESGIDSIEFSLDGRSPEENNFIRRKSSFAVVSENIKKLLDYKILYSKNNLKVYLSNTQFLPTENPGEHISLPPEAPKYLKQTFSGKYEEHLEYKCTWAMEWPHMGDTKEYFNYWTDRSDAELKSKCSLVYDTMTFRWNGDVVACCFDLTSQYVLGNISETNLNSIWNGKKYEFIRNSIQSKKHIKMCSQCNMIRPPVYLLYKNELEVRFNNFAW